MLSLNEYIRLDELEKDLFHIGKLDSPILWESCISIPVDYSTAAKQIYDYEEYQSIIYKDLIQETLSKTYNFPKFKSELDKQFHDKIEILKKYNEIDTDKPNRNRLYIQGDKKSMLSKQLQSILDLFGFMISRRFDNDPENKSIGFIIEPIYYNEISLKINKLKYLWHVIPITNEKYHILENIKKSFRDKGGLKPSKREKISKHFRRVYCWKEDVKTETIWQFLSKNEGFDGNFILVKINWGDYINEFHRKVEWFEDPNSEGIWTREIIPYQYLKFYELNNKQELENILNTKEK